MWYVVVDGQYVSWAGSLTTNIKHAAFWLWDYAQMVGAEWEKDGHDVQYHQAE